jgi:hypothetical protein
VDASPVTQRGPLAGLSPPAFYRVALCVYGVCMCWRDGEGLAARAVRRCGRRRGLLRVACPGPPFRPEEWERLPPRGEFFVAGARASRPVLEDRTLSNVKGNRSAPRLPARVTCPHSSQTNRSEPTAGASGFLNLSQSGERPER